jgi:transcriptional regulator with XRE-family HTH domain|tara:strand:- start:36 stop:260 length:225 start_codon:yes stop_codon:yes gene_type:complete
LIIEKTGNVWWSDSLKNIRKYHKMTLDDVENITGIAKPYLSQLENGKHDVKISTLEKIVDVYGYELTIKPKEEE